jgi:NhaP-type Na+/H+ or K+/H+ antiporter
MLELAGIIILGIIAQWLSWRIKIPAILPLILSGLLVGPLSTLFREDGSKLLEPIYDASTKQGLFPGESLFYFVSLSIGIILFEGGLTLRRREIIGVGPVILKLITIGSTVTFIGAGLLSHFIMGLTWPIAFLFAALVIVTGPTVIAPILQNVPLNRNVSTVLKWEGILIDPIGALVAVLVFEFIRSASGGMEFTSHALIQFVQIILIGLALGTIAAYVLYQLIKNDLIPHYLLNVFTLAFVLGVFVFSDIMAHESGLLTVVVMGMVLGNLEVPRLQEILSFKESLSILLISILFILLAANIDMSDLNIIINDWRALALFASVALVLRPLGVLISTRGSELNFNEKLFISWVGPRGIVAAGIASLFGITLTNEGVPMAEYITPLVFMIVLGTVLLNATTARPIAKMLNVIQESSSGILFIGASLASRVLGSYLKDHGRHVVMIDNNEGSVRRARDLDIEAFVVNIYTDDLNDQFELLDVGYLVAMTSSPDVNEYALSRFTREFGENGAFRLISPDELRQDPEDLPLENLLSPVDDFLNLNEVARDYPAMHEVGLDTKEQLEELMTKMKTINKSIPIFVRDNDGEIHIIPKNLESLNLAEGPFFLVYLGRELEESVVENLIPEPTEAEAEEEPTENPEP